MSGYARTAFDNLVFAFDTEIKVDTAQRLAEDLGLEFVPSEYDLG